jgi:uncharacterized protein YjbI with pentapeptide repeats
MQNTILINANIQGVSLIDTQMQGSILESSFFDSKSNFKNANLVNLIFIILISMNQER